MSKRLAMRIKVFDKCDYVEISEEMLSNHEIFLRHGKATNEKHCDICFICFLFFQVLQHFNLDPTQAASTYMFDRNNFPIPVDLYPVVAHQFTNPAVFIKLVFTLHDDTGFDLVRRMLLDFK